MKFKTIDEIIKEIKDLLVGEGNTKNIYEIRENVIFEVRNILPDGGKIVYAFVDEEINIKSLNKTFEKFLMGNFFNYYTKKKVRKEKFNKEMFVFRYTEVEAQLIMPNAIMLSIIHSPDIEKELNHAIWLLKDECRKRADAARFRNQPFKY